MPKGVVNVAAGFAAGLGGMQSIEGTAKRKYEMSDKKINAKAAKLVKKLQKKERRMSPERRK